MTQDFAQNFVRLRRCGLAAESLSELRFNHAECTLDVRSQVVMLHESLMVVLVEVERLPPHRTAAPVTVRRIRAESDVRLPALDEYQSEVLLRRISLVSRYTLDREVVRGSFHQRRKLRTVARVRVRHFRQT